MSVASALFVGLAAGGGKPAAVSATVGLGTLASAAVDGAGRGRLRLWTCRHSAPECQQGVQDDESCDDPLLHDVFPVWLVRMMCLVSDAAISRSLVP